MKKYIFLSVCLMNLTISFSQNTGIGTTSPLEKLHIDSGNIKIGRTVLASGQSNLLKFGDGNFVTVGESDVDDQMSLTASYFLFRSNGGFGGRVGIGVLSGVPSAQLEVNGPVKITDGSEGNGKVFVSNSNGLGSWSPSVSFGAHRSGGTIALPGAATATLVCDATDYDINAAYNNTNGQYTVPVSGVYHFDVSVTFSSAASTPSVRLRLRKNLTGIREVNSVLSATATRYSVGLSADVFLLQGDIIDLLIVNNSLSGLNIEADAGTTVPGSFFNGHQVR